MPAAKEITCHHIKTSLFNESVRLSKSLMALLEDWVEEGVAIATGLKQARSFFKNQGKKGAGNDHPE